MSDDPLPVYVVHYDAPTWCRDTVLSLLASDVAVSVTVVHNGGERPDLDTCEALVAGMSDNLGYTGGANWAIHDSEPSEFLLVTSHDLRVEPSTISMLLRAAHSFPDAGVLGAAVGSCSDELLGRHEDVEWRTWTSGSCLLLRRSCLREIGGFDERLHSYGDDVDLGVRTCAAGWRVGRVTSAIADQRGSSIGEGLRERMIMTNRILLAWKHQGARSVGRVVLLTLPRRVAFHLRSGIRHPRTIGTKAWMACNEVIGVLVGLSRLVRFDVDR